MVDGHAPKEVGGGSEEHAEHGDLLGRWDREDVPKGGGQGKRCLYGKRIMIEKRRGKKEYEIDAETLRGEE